MKRAAAHLRRGISFASGSPGASASTQPCSPAWLQLQHSQRGFATAAGETASQIAAQLKKPDPRFLGIAGLSLQQHCSVAFSGHSGGGDTSWVQHAVQCWFLLPICALIWSKPAVQQFWRAHLPRFAMQCCKSSYTWLKWKSPLIMMCYENSSCNSTLHSRRNCCLKQPRFQT